MLQEPTANRPEGGRRAAPRLVRVWPDFGQAIGIGRSTAFNLAASGRVKTVRIGRSVRVPVEEIDRFIERNLSGGEAA
jgi:excisionase family DNA binding protein